MAEESLRSKLARLTYKVKEVLEELEALEKAEAETLLCAHVYDEEVETMPTGPGRHMSFKRCKLCRGILFIGNTDEGGN